MRWRRWWAIVVGSSQKAASQLLPSRSSLLRSVVVYVAGALACAPAAPPPVRVSAVRAPPAAASTVAVEASPPMASPTAAPLATCAPLSLALPEVAHEEGLDVDVPDLVDASASLAPFYEKLAAVMRGTAKRPVRIAMYGDSNLTMDWITGHLRRKQQARFGDGGHGWVSVGKPWEWYHHMDVHHGAWMESWLHFAVSTSPPQDHLVGFAGIAGQSLHAGARAWVGTADAGAPVGTTASRFDVYYLARPHAGSFSIVADGKVVDAVDAAAATPHAEFRALTLDDAPHRVSVVAAGNDPVRLFGITLERESGIVVDSLGCGAISARHMAEREDQGLNADLLAHRGYDLVLELVGTNMWEPSLLAGYWRTILATHRKATPDVGVVLMSPPDTADKLTAWHSDPRIVKAGALKATIAAAEQVAFWDFRGAMGGDLSIVRFRRREMAWSDLIHLTEKGAAYMADRIDLALMRGFAAWLEVHPGAGCP